MKKLLIIVMAFSLAFIGCRKEANQIVSKPIEPAVKETRLAVYNTPTPSPSASPATELNGVQQTGMVGVILASVAGVLVAIALCIIGWTSPYGIDERDEIDDAARVGAWVERQRAIHRAFVARNGH
jgi:hypothetical protein